MNNRVIDIQKYWARVVKDTAEFQQIAIAENPELNDLLGCIHRILQDAFIHDATEYGVSRWETMLELPVEPDATLEDRKVAVLTYLSLRRPYSMRVLETMLDSALGEGNYELKYNNDKCELRLGVPTKDPSNDIVNLISRVLPQNINVIYYSLIYDHCTTVAEVQAVNPDYGTHLTADGGWYHPLRSLRDSRSMFYNNTSITKFESELPKLTYAHRMFMNSTLTEFTGGLPKCTNINEMFSYSNVKYVTITSHNTTVFLTVINKTSHCRNFYADFSNITSLQYFSKNSSVLEFKHNLKKVTNFTDALTSNSNDTNLMLEFNSALPKCKTAVNAFYGRSKCTTYRYPIDKNGDCIYESGLKQDGNRYAYLTLPELISGSNMFGLNRMDKPSAVSILNSLRQSATGVSNATWALTIGIHVDHQQDEDVLNAIDSAIAKGWTLSVQWNGTPTVSTVARMRMSPPIFAKKIDDENGNYIDGNGDKCFIDWGHLVANAEAQNEELGYTIFSSIEEAIEVWNLREDITND